MNKPVIVVDLDNVLAQSAVSFLRISDELFGTKLTLDDYQEDWSTMWGVTHEEAVRRAAVLFEHDYQCEYEPVSGAVQVLEKLKESYKLVILTSRRQISEAVTREWLDTCYPGLFPDVEFAGFWEDPSVTGGHLLTKGDLYLRLSAAYVIDDQLKHCLAAAECGIATVLFGDYPWNQADSMPAGVTRCADWPAVLEYFEGIASGSPQLSREASKTNP